MKLFFRILCLLLSSSSLLAQTTTGSLRQSMRGTVLDADTKTPIPGAVVRITTLDPPAQTVTRADGTFRVDSVPVGRHALKISSLGYEEIVLRNIIVTSGKETTITVEMKESLGESESVTVVAEQEKSRSGNTMATVSARSFSVEETQRYAASFWDPARMAQSFAGVALADDENNEIVIRGNSSRGLLWRLEGIEIPNPNHFRNGPGGSGGGISMISNTVLSNSDFFTGAFPPEYGDALSGVFDLRFRNGNSEKGEYSLQLGAAGVQAALEGPLFGNASSYLVNYRYSTLTLFDKIGIKFGGENSVAPKFQDVNFNVNIPTKGLGTIRLWGIGGLSEAGDKAVRDSNLWDNRGDKFEETETYTTGVVGLTHLFVLPNERTYLKTAIDASYEKNHDEEDTLDNSYVLHPVEQTRFVSTNYRVSLLLNHKFSPRHIIRAGVIYSSLGYNAEERDVNPATGETLIPVQDSGRTGTVQGYVGWQYRPSEEVTINAGAHYTQLLLNNRHAIEPRFGLRWQFAPNHALSYGFGLHSKVESPVAYLARREDSLGNVTQPNRNLELTKALHNVLGYDWNVTRDFRIKAEIYHQYLFDVPVAADSSLVSAINFNDGYTNRPLVSEGTGENYGLELTAEKFFSHDYYFLTTVSLFESTYKALDNVRRNTIFNSNYIVNLLGGKEFRVGSRGQNTIGTNVRLIWRGGYRTIPIDLERSREEGFSVFDIDRAYEGRAPDYYRIDLGLNYRSNHNGFSWTVSADVQNVTNRRNRLQEFYNPFTKDIDYTTYTGIIPNLNLTIEF